MSKEETLRLVVQAETTTAGLRKLLIILRNFKNQMKGEYVDAHQHTDATDMAYINSVIQRLIKPYKSPQVHKTWYKGPDGRDLDAPERFAEDVSDYYGSNITDRFQSFGGFWCPIARQCSSAHPWPHDTQAIHGRILKFANDNLPKKIYLWYRAVLNIAVRHRLQAPGWVEDIEALGQNSWCAPGESLRRSTMHAILKHVGFIDDPEPLFALGPTLKGPSDEDTKDRLIADRVAMVLDTTHTNWLKSRRSAFASMHAGKEVEINWEDEAQEQHDKFASWKRCTEFYG